jgi:hypothetical protein
MTDFKGEFDTDWADPGFRLSTCPPKQVLARFNSRQQARKGQAVSFSALARSHRVDEIAVEMAEVLTAVDAALG